MYSVQPQDNSNDYKLIYNDGKEERVISDKVKVVDAIWEIHSEYAIRVSPDKRSYTVLQQTKDNQTVEVTEGFFNPVDAVMDMLDSSLSKVCSFLQNRDDTFLQNIAKGKVNLEPLASFLLKKWRSEPETVKLLFTLLTSHGMDLSVRSGVKDSSLLHMAIQLNDPHLIAFLLQIGAPSHLKDMDDLNPLDKALFSQDINLVRVLVNGGAKTTIDKLIIHGDLELIRKAYPDFSLMAFLEKSSSELRERTLARFVINTALPVFVQEIDELLKQCSGPLKSEIKQILEDITHWLPNSARWHTEKYGSQMVQVYSEASKENPSDLYISNQLRFGKGSYDIEIKTSWDDFFVMVKAFRKKRVEIAEENKDKSPKLYDEDRKQDMKTFIAHRYSCYKPLVEAILKKAQIENLPGVKVDSNKKGYWLTYDLPDGFCVNVTHVYQDPQQGWLWYEPEPVLYNTDLLNDEIESFHKQLPSQIGDRKEFMKTLATIIWLGGNRVPTSRGSAHYMVMYLNKVCQQFSLEPLIPRREYPQIDCLAISMPMNEFVARFESFSNRHQL